MRFFLFFSIIASHIALSGDSINVALYGKPYVHYAGQEPMTGGNDPKPDFSKMNPGNMIDRNYFTYIMFPVPNIGSSVMIELSDSMRLSSVRIVNLGNFQSSYSTHIRNYRLSVSRDTIDWLIMAENSNTDSSSFIVPLSSTDRWKFVKIEITGEDVTIASVLSEFEVYAPLDGTVKIISSLVISDLQLTNGDCVKKIQWQSKNMTSDDKVNILIKEEGHPSFLPLAVNEQNDGTYEWNTSVIPNGIYVVKVEPATGTNSLPLSSFVSIQNITNVRVELRDVPVASNYSPPTRNEHFSSVFFDDSLVFDWDFVTTLRKPFRYQLSYSVDSGKSWQSIKTVSDSSCRSLTVPTPRFTGFGLYSFFSLDILIDTVKIVRAISLLPYTLIGSFDDLNASWHLSTDKFLKEDNGSFGSYVNGTTGEEKLVLGPGWKMNVSGVNQPGWSTQSFSDFSIGDINGDGIPEVVDHHGPRTENGDYLFVDKQSDPGTSLSVATDYDNNGKADILFGNYSGFSLVTSEGAVKGKYSFPGKGGNGEYYPVCADIDQDGFAEFIYGIRSTKQLHVFHAGHDYLPGFPAYVDSIGSNPIVADLFNSGLKNIIVCSNQYVYCFDHNGKLAPGFPAKLFARAGVEQLQTCVVADIDGDLYLDIIVTTSVRNDFIGEKKIYCLNRFGDPLPGWPMRINDSRIFFYWIEDYLSDNPRKWVYSFRALGSFTPPYVLSIDGDASNEIVLFNSNGFMYVLNNDGTHKTGYPRFLGFSSNKIKPHFGDFDHDGTLNVLFPIRKMDQLFIGNYHFGPGSYNPDRIPWPTYMQNVSRNPVAPQPMIMKGEVDDLPAPNKFNLSQNFPNPFNPATTISFTLAAPAVATLTVYDILGREAAVLAEGFLPAGYHTRVFTAKGMSSGIYFYVLRSGAHIETKRMSLIH